MSKTNGTTEAAEIVRNETEKMKLHFAAREQQVTLQISTLMITAGAEVLQKEFNLTIEQSAAWATLTLAKSREMLKDYERQSKNHR